MEKAHAREHLRVNNDHVDRIKHEKIELERKLQQVTQIKNEMAKILDDERQVYKESKKLFECTAERKDKELDKKESTIVDLTKECDRYRSDCHNYNLYQSGLAKEVIRELTQEINSTTSLTQLSQNSKEYAKGMKALLEQ